MTFQGLMTALVTPFSDGRVDEAAFRKLVRRQLDNGVQGLVPCGTTGEAPTLSPDEQAQLVQWTLEEAGGAVPVLAGIGSNSTTTAVTNAKRMQALGVDGVLATAPYYNKPPQAGLRQHFEAIAAAVDIEKAAPLVSRRPSSSSATLRCTRCTGFVTKSRFHSSSHPSHTSPPHA